MLAAGHMTFRFAIWLAGLARHRPAPSLRKDEDLPVYSIIVPLYREANMAASLVGALDRLVEEDQQAGLAFAGGVVDVVDLKGGGGLGGAGIAGGSFAVALAARGLENEVDTPAPDSPLPPAVTSPSGTRPPA